MKTYLGTVLMFIIFLAFSGAGYADDRDGGLAFEARLSSSKKSLKILLRQRLTLKWSLIRASRD